MAMMYVRFPFSLRNVEDLLFKRGTGICRNTVIHWWNRFHPLFAGSGMRGFRHLRWHLDDKRMKLNGETVYCGEQSSRKEVPIGIGALGSLGRQALPSEDGLRMSRYPFVRAPPTALHASVDTGSAAALDPHVSTCDNAPDPRAHSHGQLSFPCLQLAPTS